MAEEKVQRSLFIGRVEPCHDEAEARAILARVQAEHRDATHNCWAYLLGPAPATEYSSDDGEPSGTAGRPILGALKRSGMVNAMVVVTRYFGGIKLGVRGLIDAYGGVATKAIQAARPVERLRTCPFVVSLPWAAIGIVTRLLEDHGATGMTWDYGEEPSVYAGVPLSMTESLARALNELKARGTIGGWDPEWQKGWGTRVPTHNINNAD